jgi:hypothetical protein
VNPARHRDRESRRRALHVRGEPSRASDVSFPAPRSGSPRSAVSKAGPCLPLLISTVRPGFPEAGCEHESQRYPPGRERWESSGRLQVRWRSTCRLSRLPR